MSRATQLWCIALVTAMLAPAAVSAAEVLVIKSAAQPAYDQAIASFRSSLSDHTITIDDLAGDHSRIPAATERARRSSAALVVAVGPLAAEVARGAGKPVVSLLVPDSAAATLRGDKMTGVRMDVAPARQLALIRKLLPRARRIAVIYDPARSQAAISAAREAAGRLGLTLVETRVESERAVPVAVRRLQGDALWLIVDDTVVTRRSYPLILRASLSARIPTVTFSQDLVRAGALAALEADFRDSGRKAATLARRILDGSLDLAPVHPEGRLFLNDRVGAQLGVTIPDDVRRRVGQVFVP